MKYSQSRNQNQSQLSSSNRDSITGQNEQNDNDENLKMWLTVYKQNPPFFNWLLNIFDIWCHNKTFSEDYQNYNLEQERQKINNLKNAIKNPIKLLETFENLYTKLVELQKKNNNNQELQQKNNYLKNNNYTRHKNTISLKTENQQLKEQVDYLQQQNQSQVSRSQTKIDELEKENQELGKLNSSLLSKLNARERDSKVIQLQTKIDELEKENQELHKKVNYLGNKLSSYHSEIQVNKPQKRIEQLESENQELNQRVSSLLSKLNARDRDKSTTITSNESRRQRDILTQEFIQLNTQEITGFINEIFNHLSQINSNLKANRKREIAKIKSVFSKHIFDKGSQRFTADNSIEEDNSPQVVEDFTNSILTDLPIPETAKIPEPIRTNLKNLVEKGLKLVKEIVNDDPPGHFLIANQGEAFDPEKHQPVAGCEPSGNIVHTTYPGYCVDNRIIGEALKAFVFTEPDK